MKKNEAEKIAVDYLKSRGCDFSGERSGKVGLLKFSLPGQTAETGRLMVRANNQVEVWNTASTRPLTLTTPWIDASARLLGKRQIPVKTVDAAALLTLAMSAAQQAPLLGVAPPMQKQFETFPDTVVEAAARQNLEAYGWTFGKTLGNRITECNDGAGKRNSCRFIVNNGIASVWSYRGDVSLPSPWQTGRNTKDGCSTMYATGKSLGLGSEQAVPITQYVKPARVDERGLLNPETIEFVKRVWEAGVIAPDDHPALIKYGAQLNSNGLLAIPESGTARRQHAVGNILVPLYRADDRGDGLELVGGQRLLQTPFNDSDKYFVSGTPASGVMAFVPPPRDLDHGLQEWLSNINPDQPLILAESVAAGMALQQSGVGNVICALSAKNMPVVAQWIEKSGVIKSFSAGVVIAADNDYECITAGKNAGKLKSTGIMNALQAAEILDASVALANHGKHGMDARDLLAEGGNLAVRQYVENRRSPDEVRQQRADIFNVQEIDIAPTQISPVTHIDGNANFINDERDIAMAEHTIDIGNNEPTFKLDDLSGLVSPEQWADFFEHSQYVIRASGNNETYVDGENINSSREAKAVYEAYTAELNKFLSENQISQTPLGDRLQAHHNELDIDVLTPEEIAFAAEDDAKDISLALPHEVALDEKAMKEIEEWQAKSKVYQIALAKALREEIKGDVAYEKMTDVIGGQVESVPLVENQQAAGEIGRPPLNPTQELNVAIDQMEDARIEAEEQRIQNDQISINPQLDIPAYVQELDEQYSSAHPPVPAPSVLAAQDASTVTTNLPLSVSELTGEQQKRLDLLNEYELATHDMREARNVAIDEHESGWRERWLNLQGEIDQARATRAEQLSKDGTPAEHHAGILAKESADLIEHFEIEKDAAARKLDDTLPKPTKWLDFLKERVQQNPDDLSLSSLLEEAEKSPDAGLEGYGGQPIKVVTLSDLVHSIDKDGSLNYKRGLSTVIRDTGARLDVKRLDNRDIEAALKIAAQKFDMSKGLMLTGDAAFKMRSAEIAGKLGLPLQNSEPEVLMAWKRGHDQNAELKRAVVPSVERGITGDLLVPKPSIDLHGEVQLRADARTIEHADALGVIPNGEGVLNLSSERLMAANAVIRETPIDTLRQLATADLSKQDGGLSDKAKALLTKENLIDGNGHLTQSAKDAVIVRDDKVLRKRDSIDPQLLAMNPAAYRTSGEKVREAESLQELEQMSQAQQEIAVDEQTLRTRNIDERLEKKDEHKREQGTLVQHAEGVGEVIEEAQKIEIDAKAPQLGRKSRSQDIGMGM